MPSLLVSPPLESSLIEVKMIFSVGVPSAINPPSTVIEFVWQQTSLYFITTPGSIVNTAFGLIVRFSTIYAILLIPAILLLIKVALEDNVPSSRRIPLLPFARNEILENVGFDFNDMAIGSA